MKTVYDFAVKDRKGGTVSLKEYANEVLLIVNTATKCGFTPQFKGLEELNQKYKDLGLVTIGFPCNQFNHQDPGTDSEIEGFCQLNYGVTFQIMKKIDVNGDDAHPIFKFLKSKTKGLLGSSIKWNFTKFLVSRDGEVIKRYAPTTAPEKLVKDIEEMLG